MDDVIDRLSNLFVTVQIMVRQVYRTVSNVSDALKPIEFACTRSRITPPARALSPSLSFALSLAFSLVPSQGVAERELQCVWYRERLGAVQHISFKAQLW